MTDEATATRLMAELASLGCHVRVESNQLHVTPGRLVPRALRERIAANKAAIVEHCRIHDGLHGRVE